MKITVAFGILIAPFTSSLYAGDVVSMPTLPALSIRMRSEPAVEAARVLAAGK